METKTIAIAVIALIVGAGIGWLAFTTYYADDLATAASVNEAIGDEAYLARGIAPAAARYNLDCQPKVAGQFGLRCSKRTPTPTATPTPIPTPTPTATPSPTPPGDSHAGCQVFVVKNEGEVALADSASTSVTLHNPLRLSGGRPPGAFLLDANPVSSFLYAYNETNAELNGYWYMAPTTGYFTKATAVTTSEGDSITFTYFPTEVSLALNASRTITLPSSVLIQTSNPNGFLFNRGTYSPGNTVYFDLYSPAWAIVLYYLGADGYFRLVSDWYLNLLVC
ncbi:MAG: hypothetical protein AB1626_03600 [Candidatus Micrarchaeota archaeon]